MESNTLCPECGYPITWLGVNSVTHQDEHLCRRCGTLMIVTKDTYAGIYPAWWQKGGTTEAYNLTFDWIVGPLTA